MNLSNASATANLVWAVLESTLILGAGLKFFFTIKARLDNIENYTYKRNGGSSMADSLARLEDAVKENTKLTQKTATAVAKLEGRFDNHIEENRK